MKGIGIIGISEEDKSVKHLMYVGLQLQFFRTFQMEIVPSRSVMNEHIIVLESIDSNNSKLDNFKLQKFEIGDDKFVIGQIRYPYSNRGKKLKENRMIPRYIKYFNIRRTLPTKNS